MFQDFARVLNIVFKELDKILSKHLGIQQQLRYDIEKLFKYLNLEPNKSDNYHPTSLQRLLNDQMLNEIKSEPSPSNITVEIQEHNINKQSTRARHIAPQQNLTLTAQFYQDLLKQSFKAKEHKTYHSFTEEKKAMNMSQIFEQDVEESVPVTQRIQTNQKENQKQQPIQLQRIPEKQSNSRQDIDKQSSSSKLFNYNYLLEQIK